VNQEVAQAIEAAVCEALERPRSILREVVVGLIQDALREIDISGRINITIDEGRLTEDPY